MFRNRSRSPTLSERRGQSRGRVRSPIQFKPYSGRAKFNSRERSTSTVREYKYNARFEIPKPMHRPRTGSQVPYTSRVDQWGIPVYPEEPEPQMSKFGRDSEGHIIRNPNASVKTKPSTIEIQRNLKYPPVPHFNDPKIAPSVDRLAYFTLSAFPNGLALQQSNEADAVTSSPLRDISNNKCSKTNFKSQHDLYEEDLIDLDGSWTPTTNRAPSPDDLIDFTSSPIWLPTKTLAPASSPCKNATQASNGWEHVSSQCVSSQDPYIVLGIKWGASNDEILSAYNTLKKEVELDFSAAPTMFSDAKQRIEALDNARRKLIHY